MSVEKDDLLAPAPYFHDKETVGDACSIKVERSRGVDYHMQQLWSKKYRKTSMVVEFIEQALDLTHREQILLAFELGRRLGDE